MERKIYILLTDTGTLFTRMIKLYTKREYNHASIAFDLDLNEVYSFGRKRPRNPFIGGFVKENIKGELFQDARCALYSCTVTMIQFESTKDYIHEIEKHKHLYSYNLLGLLTFLLNKPVTRDKSFFCSEFVATVLQKGDIVNFTKPIELITPSDLQELGIFQLEYEGDLANLYSNEHYITKSPTH